MKTTIKSILAIGVAIFLSTNLTAQNQPPSADKQKPKIDTIKFEVKGNCGLCKERIENAALIKGVKWVDWNKVTDTLTLIYRTDKVNILDVHNSIAEAGHTTDKVKCNMDAYNKLPACCAYMGDAE